jgi:nucleoside 2-deoxyribosyltransferase
MADQIGRATLPDPFFFVCKTCGNFAIDERALVACGRQDMKDKWMISAYTREKTIQRIEPVLYSNQAEITVSCASGSVTLDAAKGTFPRTFAERLDRTLLNLGGLSREFGTTLKLNQLDYPVGYARHFQEFDYIFNSLVTDGYMRGVGSWPGETKVLPKGWNRIAELQRGLHGPENKQVFVAMAFDALLDEAWLNGLKPGIEDSGYDPLRVDFKQHNEKICDVIIAEIRRSKFLVADFSRHRGGVYFEAGLMMGLGRPVIFTCRKRDMKKAHFDTRQYNHIEWETPTDLREQLKRRIQATIAP